MFFNDKLTPSKISPQSKAQEMRDISKKAIRNAVEREYNKILALIRATAEAGYRDFITYQISRNVDEVIQKLKNDGFEVDNKLDSEYPYLTIKW